MLTGITSNVKRFDINTILNINNRINTFYGHSINEVVELNKLAVVENKIQNVSIFEDSIGTIPVIEHNQKIGLVLDKSNKLVRGIELITSTNLSTFTVLGTGSKTNNSITTTAANSGVILNTLVPGTWYEVIVDFTSTTTAEFTINTYDSVSSTVRKIKLDKGRAIFMAEYSKLYLKHSTGGLTSGLTVSLKTLPGHHLIQDDNLLKPILSYQVNRVLSSEDLEDISWTNTNVVIENSVLAPDGTLTAFSLKNTVNLNSKLTQSNTYFTDQPGQYLRTIYIKPGEEVGATIVFEGVGGPTLNTFVNFNCNTKIFGLSTVYLDELEDGWLYVWIKLTQTNTKFVSNNIYIGNQNTTATQHEVIVWHPDNRLSIHAIPTLPKYQATYNDGTVNTLNFFAYLDVNNESYLQTNIDLITANRALVLTSFTVMNNETNSIYLEFGHDSDTEVGTFGIKIPAGQTADAVLWSGRGSIVKNIIEYFTGSLPKHFSVLGYIDLTSPEIRMTINGINKPPTISTLGTGNFTSRPLFLFRRNGDSLNGNFHVTMLPTIIFMDSSDVGLTKSQFKQLNNFN